MFPAGPYRLDPRARWAGAQEALAMACEMALRYPAVARSLAVGARSAAALAGDTATARAAGMLIIVLS